MMGELFALLIFVSVLVGTPGPANMVMMSAGLNYGYRRSVPFLVGIIAGKLALNIALGVGFYDLIQRYPLLLDVLKYVSGSYMLWLSYRMARTPINTDVADLQKPPGPLEGLIVHPLNPKAYAMITIAWTDYGPDYDTDLTRILVIGGCFLLVQIIAHSLWCIAGVHLTRMISNDKTKHKVQIALAIITALVVLYVVIK
jgi:threonine/homoserine/homoserine lactone efflux protein